MYSWVNIEFDSNLTQWLAADSHKETLASEYEETGPETVFASVWFLSPVYMNHPADIQVSYSIFAEGEAKIERSDGIALHSSGEVGQYRSGKVVLYDYDNDQPLAAWYLNY